MATNKPKINRIGHRYGRLLVVEYAGVNNRKKHLWKCICDCGSEKITLGNYLGIRTNSCGCLKEGNNPSMKFSTHGMRNSSEYKAWSEMRQRCGNPNNDKYKLYGNRGIRVCPEWENFETFYADMGPKPKGHSLDRINNNGDYEKSNCRWATQTQQVRNRNTTRKLTVNGVTRPIAEWCEIHKIEYGTLWRRLKVGELPPYCFRAADRRKELDSY